MSSTTESILTPFQELRAATLGRFLAVAFMAEAGDSSDYIREQLVLIRKQYMQRDKELLSESQLHGSGDSASEVTA